MSGPSFRAVLSRGGLGALFDALHAQGRTIVGPRARDGAIVLDTLESPADLPAGWGTVQDAGTYRLERRGTASMFAHGPAAQAWKRFLLPPVERLHRIRRVDGAFAVEDGPDPPYLALLGLRACDLAGLSKLDDVMMRGPYPDPRWAAARERALTIVVECVEAPDTCFCASTGTGPSVSGGFDLALTERAAPNRHEFLARAGSRAGEDLLESIPSRVATEDDVRDADRLIALAAIRMVRRLDETDLPEILREAVDHPRWDDVAERCLACGNCTMVCPTCFCATVSDEPSLDGSGLDRVRRLDSCFAPDFTRMHGGGARESVRARYRHWLVHKLGTWPAQFGSSGCVGCGRCIAWCPAGIDITEEARVLRRGA